MTFTSKQFSALAACALIGLAGCEEFPGTIGAHSAESEAAAALGPSGPVTEIRDVERPDIFSASEPGLWDGRPSLGGIWVAHPDVELAERAQVTNTKNGQTIGAALFRRERDLPGPRIQVSSDAATALGMLAGQPVELSIIVLRQEEIVIEPAPLPIAEEPEGTEAETDPDPTDEDGAEVAAVAAGVVAATADKPKEKGFWGRFRDSLRNDPSPTAETELTEETAESAAFPDVETAPLDPVTTAAAAAITAAELSEETRPVAKPAPTSGLKNPYIQVGLFGQEENASAAAASLRQAGIVPEIRGQKSGDKTLWRVFVGPVSTADDQAALLAQIKQLGYQDAFLAPN